MPVVLQRTVFFACFMCYVAIAMTQDIHFTHFRMAPVSFNPSLNGTFQGTYRISAIYRDQWRSVSNSSPYKTPFVSAEVNIAGGLLLENDWISGGLSFVSDRSGTLTFKQQLTNLNVGYHIGLDDDYNNVFSIGFSYGSGSQGLNINNLNLPNRLLTGSNGETFAADPNGDISKSYSDLGIGVSYKATLNDGGDLVRFGVSAAHLLGPDISLVSGAPSQPGGPPVTGPRRTDLDTRLTAHVESSFLTSDKIRVNPAILAQLKSGFTEMAIQGTADYLLNARKQTVVTAGLGYRLGDALELLAGIQLKDLRIGISYDLTTSSFTEAGGGAFELAVGYVGRIYKSPDVKPVIFCPRL